MTHEVDLDLAYLGDPPEERAPEGEAELSDEFRIYSFRQMAVLDRLSNSERLLGAAKCEFERGWRKLKDYKWLGRG
jgi:hypothetical protein